MKKRILSLVLCAAMLLSMCLFLGAGVVDDTTAEGSAETTESYIPAVNFTNVAPFVQANAQAANGPARAPMLAANANGDSGSANKGVVTSKTATANEDGTYTITLEAYATGSKVISEIQKDVPTDIVLVLDQSGSMTDAMGTVTYKPYSSRNSTNADNYDRRHNGGDANLWHKLGDGSYVSVSVSRQEKWTYTQLGNLKNGKPAFGGDKGYSQYADDGNLYEKVDTEYKKVTVTRERNGGGYTYTYTFDDGSTVVSSGYNNAPNLGVHYPLYAGSMDYEYTYTYTDSTGAVQTIGTSTGANANYAQFYERSVSSSGGGSRLAALKSAATEFANSVATKAAGKDNKLGTGDDINHRIAVVGFACGQWYGGWDYNYENTEVFVGKNQYTYGTAAQGQYKNAFQDMNNATGVQNVSDSIGALAADGGTLTNLGLEMANGIFQSNPITQGETRNRVVVVFTDGVPGWNGYDSEVAQSAIAQANIAKTTHSATVYSIGIFAGADATSQGNKSGSDTQQANWFMQNLSSNNGAVKNPSYYLSAADAESLKNIFKQISDQIENGGSSTTLSSDAVVKDVISPQFQLPKGAAAKDIQLETYACTGKTGDTYTWLKNNGTMGAKATVENDTVSVTGFDFAGNWCGMETQTDGSKVLHGGNKLVISFKVEPKAGFLGGNDVLTNDSAAIYDSSAATEPVCTFNDKPQVNVPIKDVTVTGADKNVYLLDDLTADQLKDGATVKVGNVTLNLTMANDSERPYGLEKWQTDYVNITVAVTDETGNAITDSDLSNLTDDTKYTVSVTVAPKTESPTSTEGTLATAKTASVTSKVNVFKPELTFKDSEGYYGDTAPAFTGNLTDTVWKHSDTKADTNVMGQAPELTISYTPDTDAVVGGKINTRTDFVVAASVKIGDTDVTEHTKFHHTFCDGKTCALPEGKAFLCHVNTCSLKITKNVTGEGENPNQTFVFNVMKGDDLVTTVVLKGNMSTTITGLAVGDYTVVEDTNWSWSYTPDNGSKAVMLSSINPNGEAKITNTAKENHWLTSIVDVINKWTAKDNIDKTGHVPGSGTN